MYEQINAQFAGFTKQATDAAMKAHSLAFENAERVFGLQLRSLEAGMAATADFISEAAETRQASDVQSLFPKGLQVARENTERFLQAGQEAFAETLKTQQAMGQIVKAQFEAAGEQVKQAASKATKAAK